MQISEISESNAPTIHSSIGRLRCDCIFAGVTAADSRNLIGRDADFGNHADSRNLNSHWSMQISEISESKLKRS